MIIPMLILEKHYLEINMLYKDLAQCRVKINSSGSYEEVFVDDGGNWYE